MSSVTKKRQARSPFETVGIQPVGTFQCKDCGHHWLPANPADWVARCPQCAKIAFRTLVWDRFKRSARRRTTAVEK
jgi:predicted Zn-ribbon and HTH transcriptional regulator